MTRDEAVTIIGDRLGQRTNLTTQIQNELKLAQIRLERSPELPWFLLVDSSGFTTGTTAGSTNLPTGFLREHEDENMLVQDTATGEWTEVEKIFGADGKIKEISAAASKPQFYTLFETTLRFWPDPDKDYNLYWPYYKADAVLTTNVENKWLKYHPDVLICSAGIQISRFLRDQGAISMFGSDLSLALATMRQETVARREFGRRAWMGG